MLNAAWSGCLYSQACRAHGQQPGVAEREGRLSTLGFWHLALDAEDHPDYPIAAHFDEAVGFLRRCRSAGRKVLVHCVAGLNRAPCLCAAFLMREGLSRDGPGFSAAQAVAWISQRRADVFKNLGFLKQLLLEEGCHRPTSLPVSKHKPAREAISEQFLFGTVQERHEGRAGHAPPRAEKGHHRDQHQSRFKAAQKNMSPQ